MNIDFEALLDQSPNPYVILDRDLRLVWMNDAYLAVTMRTRDDIVGQVMFDAFPSEPGTDSHDFLADSFAAVLETGQTDEIALIRYDIPRQDGTMEQRYWSATHTPLLGPDGAVEYILQHTVDVTELHNLRKMRDEQGLVSRASAIQARNRNLAAESRQLMDFFEQAPGFVAALGGPDHRFQMSNEAYRALVGRQDLLGKTVREALPEVIDQGFVDILDQVYASGEAFEGRRTPVVLDGEDLQGAQRRYLTFIFQPIFDDHETVKGIIVQGYDVTEEVEYEERQDLLIDELNHRVKNTLAIVQGLAAQSFGAIAEASAPQAVFNARLKALSAAHTLLTEAHWGTASIDEIVHSSAGATMGELVSRRFTAEGPDLSLEPQAAVSLAMIVHELSTNAIKYGALCNDTGHVRVSWGLSGEPDERMLWFRWREEGGPPVRQPSRRGFGTRLIGRGFSSGAGSRTNMQFMAGGLDCLIETRYMEPAT